MPQLPAALRLPLCSLPEGHMPSVLPLPTSLCLPPGTSPCCTAWVQRCLAAAGVCGCSFSKPRSSSCFVHAGDGTKTSRTTTMESSYMKRSDSKSFSCPFPTASSGCNPGALLLLSRHCPGAGRVLPAWHSSCSGPLSFLSLCRWQQYFRSNQIILQLLIQKDRQVSRGACGDSPTGPLSLICLHKPCAQLAVSPLQV